MTGGRVPPGAGGRSGFTLVELLVVILVALLLIGGAYQTLMSQTRLHSVSQQSLDARESVRAATAMIAWDLRSIAPEDGDLYSVTPDSLVLRSARATGVICSAQTVSGGRRFGLQHSSGGFTVTSDDSVLVHTLPDSSWSPLAVTESWTGSSAWASAPAGGGTPVCFWADSTTSVPRPQVAIHAEGDSIALEGLRVGSPLVLFRHTTYALFPWDGRWWLGVRTAGATEYEVLSGPMRAPSDGGLVFTYLDASGAATTDPALVTRIEFSLVSESFESFAGNPMVDSLSSGVYLRNNGAP